MTKTVIKPLPAHLLSKWHPTKNLPLLPSKVSIGSSKRIIHWMCEEGHEWSGSVSNESKKATHCKHCAIYTVKVDGTDLSSKFPNIAKQWNPTKNGRLLPTMINAGSHSKAWWLGECGHEWEAKIESRTVLGQGCPFCSSNKVLEGFNDFVTTCPLLASEWHPTKNGSLTPQQVSKGTNKKVWWLGKCGHEWDMTVNARGSSGQNCPYCSGNRLLVGFNDFASKMPEFIKEWDVEKNELTPYDYSYGASHQAWWKCLDGHSWKAPIYSRAKYGCPECARLNAGVTKATPKNGSDLATVNPTMAAEWHPTKNGNMKASDVNAGAKAHIWWQCNHGHEWEAKISDRRFYQTGCPVCALAISISKGHQAISDYLVSNGINVINNDRKILDGKEIDMFLPDFNVGIEYNGIYWHTEDAGKDRKYHWDKWNQTKQKGVQLIQIWEDEWNNSPELIKNMLSHKIGLSVQKKIFARKTTIGMLIKKEAETFLIANHIQGYASGSYYIGLYDKTTNEVVSLLVLKKEKGNILNIIRYATSANVVGGFTKLLAYAEKNLDVDKFITFSDHCVSDGGLYANNGFIADKELVPDYRYVVKNQRQHKFGYRLKKFRDDPELKWDENLSERELAQLNGIPRIWDAGKTRWVKEVS